MNLKKSLKPIKQRLANTQQAYTTIRRVYTHLKDFSNTEILDYYQVSDVEGLAAHIEQIKTILKNKTDNYKEALEEIDTCFCRDAKGAFKYLYHTQQEAYRQQLYTQKIKHIKLKIYPCPYHCGWHLSRQ
jgi:hypothetical protein